MDYIRSCYRGSMYSFDPETGDMVPFAVRWYRPPHGARPIGIRHQYGSGIWDLTPTGTGEVGEIPGASRTYDKGAAPAGVAGTGYCGDPDMWTGRLVRRVTPIANNPMGQPICCPFVMRVGPLLVRPVSTWSLAELGCGLCGSDPTPAIWHVFIPYAGLPDPNQGWWEAVRGAPPDYCSWVSSSPTPGGPGAQIFAGMDGRFHALSTYGFGIRGWIGPVTPNCTVGMILTNSSGSIAPEYVYAYPFAPISWSPGGRAAAAVAPRSIWDIPTPDWTGEAAIAVAPQSTWTVAPAGWCSSYPDTLSFPGDPGFAGGPWNDMASSFVLNLVSVDPVHVIYTATVGALFISVEIDQTTGSAGFDAGDGTGDIVYRATWDCSGANTFTWFEDQEGWPGDPDTITCS